MRSIRTISIVQCHAEGEVGDVIIGGVLDAPNTCKTMYEKLQYFMDPERDSVRNLLLQEPRGRSSMNTNLILSPCNPEAAAGFLIMESDEYAPMSGSNTICTATVLLECGMIPMKEGINKFSLDTVAGLVGVTAECTRDKCLNVEVGNVPSFVIALDRGFEVPGLGIIKVDVAYGGMICALVDASSCGMQVDNMFGQQLIEWGEKIKRAIQRHYTPVHPENPGIRGVSGLVLTQPLEQGDGCKTAVNTVIVSPGRFDRSPCGTGSCARMAVLHARGLLEEGEVFRHKSIIGTEFVCQIKGTSKVGEYTAIVPSLKGRAWISGTKQVLLDPDDPFPEGFRVGDQWNMTADSGLPGSGR